MSPEELAKALDDPSGKCPWCGSTTTETLEQPDYVPGEYNLVSDLLECSCGKVWSNVYKMISIHEDYSSDEGEE